MKEKDIFIKFLKGKNLKLTRQREQILQAFLKTEKHVSTEELYKIISKKYPSIGQATVFRTLKLLHEVGIAREVSLGDKTIRFEHNYGHRHHGHLICTDCGRLVEAIDDNIEQFQEKLCKKFGFIAKDYKFEILGLCKHCNRK
ncbi:MAG: transcriptional repressor [Candidatus Omnitrophica bacterium]|jgi:Fur family ferric uptake transcriptional regulator|nr:transcriptional repressor [Candidatus Omnitrophota bacterium]